MAGDAVQVGDSSAPTGRPDGAEDPRHGQSPGRGPHREPAQALVAGGGADLVGGRGAVRDSTTAPPPPALLQSQRARRGPPRRCPRQAAGSSASEPHALFVWVFSVRLLAGAASPGAGAWHPAADRSGTRPVPLPRTTKPGPPPPADVFTMVLTPPRWAPVGGSA